MVIFIVLHSASLVLVKRLVEKNVSKVTYFESSGSQTLNQSISHWHRLAVWPTQVHNCSACSLLQLVFRLLLHVVWFAYWHCTCAPCHYSDCVPTRTRQMLCCHWQLEDAQREGERLRKESKQPFPTKVWRFVLFSPCSMLLRHLLFIIITNVRCLGRLVVVFPRSHVI